jgi:adenylate cyclase
MATGETDEALRLASTVIELTDGDPLKGKLLIESPVALAVTWRAGARLRRGEPGWRQDIERAAAMAWDYTPEGLPQMLYWKYGVGIPSGALLADARAAQEAADTLDHAQRYGDDVALVFALFLRGLILAQQDGPQREEGLRLLATAREAALEGSLNVLLPSVDIEFAKDKARTRDFDAAIELLRAVVDRGLRSGDAVFHAVAVAALAESLLARGADADIDEADTQVQRLARAAQANGDMAIEVIWLLRSRALLARARGDEAAYRDFRDRYRDMATTIGYEGHMKWAEAMG